MIKPVNLKPLLPKRIFPTIGIAKAQKSYLQTQDIFEKGDSVKSAAVSFKKMVFESLDDWKTSVPRDNEDGATHLKKILAPYTVFTNKLNSHDAERFTKLAFGENQVEFIENASVRNKDVKLFKSVLEKRLGKSIREVVVK